MDKICHNFRLAQQHFGQTLWEVLGKYPYWIALSERFANQSNPITARFAGLDLYWASPLELVGDGKAKGEVLVTTSPDGWLQLEGPYPTIPEQAETLIDQRHPRQGRYPVVVALSGQLNSSFRDRPIPVRRGEMALQGRHLEASAATRLVVIGDTDFATELFRYTEASYNLQFVSNVVSWLLSSEELLSIKTRAVRDLRLNRIQDPGIRARLALLSEIITVAVVPLVVVAFGVGRLLVRRRASDRPSGEGR